MTADGSSPHPPPTLLHTQIKTTPIDLTSTVPPPLKTAALAAENAMRHGTPRRTSQLGGCHGSLPEGGGGGVVGRVGQGEEQGE